MNTHPLLIDNLAFAKKNEHLKGHLSLADCPRLSELLQAPAKDNALKSKADAVIDYLLQGEVNSVGQHFLHLTLTTNLAITCQRCLSEMPLKLTLHYHYLISEANIDDVEALDMEDSDEIDLQSASQTMDLVALIEDEIIMAMPIAPMHDEDCGAAVTQSGEKPNPFAALKNLIKT